MTPTSEVGPAVRPLARLLGAETMRVWQAVAATAERAEDWASPWTLVFAGQSGCVPQLSPSGEVSE